MAAKPQTRSLALKEAQKFLQASGFSNFSFQHIADKLGIKKPSLYTHFESKEALGLALIVQYQDSFLAWVEVVNEFNPYEKIKAFFDIYLRFSRKGSLYCPIASLTAELPSLPSSMQKKLHHFFQLELNWLTQTIQEGQKEKEFRKDLKSTDLARFVVAQSIGGQFLARITNDSEQIRLLKSQAMLFLRGVKNE